jgi:hypothetical protein
MALDLEGMIVELLRPRLSDEEKRDLSTKQSISEHIDEESRDEMKEELFWVIWNRVSAHRIIEVLMRDVEDETAEDPPSSDEEEED